MGKYKEHLCWMCNKACNSNSCIWVRTLRKLPKGAKRDKNNNIIECPLFVHDGGIYTLEDKLRKYGFNRRQYETASIYVKRHNLDTSPLKYLLEKRKYKEMCANMSRAEYRHMLYMRKVKKHPIEVLGDDAFIDKKQYVKKPKKPKLTYRERQANKMGLTLEEYEEYIKELRHEQIFRMLELKKLKNNKNSDKKPL